MNKETNTEAVQGLATGRQPGFIRRFRLPLFLGVVALCLYASSILYILFVKGPIG